MLDILNEISPRDHNNICPPQILWRSRRRPAGSMPSHPALHQRTRYPDHVLHVDAETRRPAKTSSPRIFPSPILPHRPIRIGNNHCFSK
jgi:hypothetical protein